MDKKANFVRLRRAGFVSGRVISRMPDSWGHLIFWPLAAGGVAFDLWSKAAIFECLRHKPGGTVTIIEGFLEFISVYNRGAAFGIADGQRGFLTIISVIALVVILGLFLFSGVKQRILQVAFGLFAAGVCGNLYDRIFNEGRVRDFIDIVYWPGKHWPAFNVADSLLVIAVGLVIASSLLSGDPPLADPQRSNRGAN